ncbi:general secretion pathway protein GspB [Lysobacter hankyongensis]|uniref:Type II secretion system protein GspB C-terminal domain-containing protein n=1 Tax=Lysobacter hankyongensis TaxID=1176535 RepID=A0ABP9B8B8_9GAMM
MSFILDALRKSEAARRRSEAPDLFATMPQTAEPERARRTWPLWAIAGLGVLSLIAAIWLVALRPAMPPATTRVDDTQAPALEAPSPQAAAPTAAAPAADSPPVVEVPPASTTSIPTPAPLPSVPVPSTPAASAPVASPPVATPTTATPRELPSPPPTATPPVPPPASDQPIALADLDPATRNQLPPLKLSMHLWNETPSGRFVILDGQRLKEGDVLGEVVVERITRDGAVLVWRGGRLKIALQ